MALRVRVFAITHYSLPVYTVSWVL